MNSKIIGLIVILGLLSIVLIVAYQPVAACKEISDKTTRLVEGMGVILDKLKNEDLSDQSKINLITASASLKESYDKSMLEWNDKCRKT